MECSSGGKREKPRHFKFDRQAGYSSGGFSDTQIICGRDLVRRSYAIPRSKRRKASLLFAGEGLSFEPHFVDGVWPSRVSLAWRVCSA
eukprot:9064691-Pyramimonas_sp.AAC.1